MERDLGTEIAILEVRERQFHRFPFSMPALNALLRQANIVRSLESKTETGDGIPPDSNKISHPKTTSSDYYRSRDKKTSHSMKR